MPNNENLILEDVRLIFRNFSGAATQYNRKGNRETCVVLTDQELVDRMIEDGWNVKVRQPREEGDDPLYYIRVKVSYFDEEDDRRNPKIMLISGKNRRYLYPDELGCLDYMDIQTADMTIRPYHYDVNGKTGVTGYLKSLYVTQRLDALEAKYADEYDDEENPY